jgi:hypothetical protein
MDIITALSIIEHLGIIADWAEATHFIGLLEDCSHSILRGIHFQGIQMIRVGLLEDWVAQDNLLEPLNGCCTVGSPGEGYILLSEFGQGLGNVGEASDKWLLVTEHTEHTPNLFHSGQLFRPSGQTITLCWIDTDHTITDNDA